MGRPLYGIRMKENAFFMAQGPYGLDGLDGANLVIGRHDADEGRIWAQGFLTLSGLTNPSFEMGSSVTSKPSSLRRLRLWSTA